MAQTAEITKTDPLAVDPTGGGVPMPMVLAGLDGLPLDGQAETGSGSAVSDVLLQFDTTGRQTCIAYFPTPGGSCYVDWRGSLDGGQTWKAIPQVILDRFGQGPVSGSFQVTSTITLAVDTLGFTLVQCKISSISSGTCVAVGRALSRSLPPEYFIRPTTSVNIASGAAGVLKNTPIILKGWNLLNTTAAVRFLQIYSKTTTPVPASDTALIIKTIPMSANANIHAAGVRHQVNNAVGLGWAITTDAAGTTIATSGDVVGSIDIQG